MAGNSNGRKIRVISIDDHIVVQRGIAAMIGTDPTIELVAQGASAHDAVELYREYQPDVVLMDLRLRGTLDGVDATREICKQWSKARILVLTTYGGDESVHRAIAAGARGYLVKDTLDDRLFDAIHAVYEGRRFVSSDVAVKLAEHGPRVELTDRERQVLALMARGLRNKEIGSELQISEATARTHVERISAKLGVSSRTEAVVIAIQRGFVSVD